MKKDTNQELPIIAFQTQKKFRSWLLKNYKLNTGIWMRIFKKDSGVKSINHDQALDEGLCFGWIDGQAKKYDEQSYIQKFTPRRKRSLWSKRNRENVERLIKNGKIHQAGIAEIELAKADGRWEKAYDSPSASQVPDDLIKELSKKPEALAFFNKLNKTNKYAIVWRLQTAVKPETRAKRFVKIIEMIERGEKFH